MPGFVVHSPTDGEVWVREEESGCIMYSQGRYAEGNETAFQVLELMAAGDEPPAIAKKLAERHGVDVATVEAGIRSMFERFAAAGWFVGVHEQLCAARPAPGNGGE